MQLAKFLLTPYGFLALNTKANTVAIGAVYIHVEVIFLTLKQIRNLIVLRHTLYIACWNFAISERRVLFDFYPSRLRLRINLPKSRRMPIFSIISLIRPKHQ